MSLLSALYASAKVVATHLQNFALVANRAKFCVARQCLLRAPVVLPPPAPGLERGLAARAEAQGLPVRPPQHQRRFVRAGLHARKAAPPWPASGPRAGRGRGGSAPPGWPPSAPAAAARPRLPPAQCRHCAGRHPAASPELPIRLGCLVCSAARANRALNILPQIDR